MISLGAAQGNLVPGFDLTLIDSAEMEEKGFCKSYSRTIEAWVYRIRLSEVEMDVEVGVDGRILSVNVLGESWKRARKETDILDMAPLYPGILKHYEDVRGRKYTLECTTRTRLL